MLTILFAVLAAVANAVSSVLQRKANVREVEADRSGAAGLVDLLRQPLWLGGIGMVIVAFGLQAAALSTGQVSEVQPILALELPVTLLLASMVFRRPLSRRSWVDIAVMTAGMAVFLYALRPTEGAPGRAAGLAWALATGSTGLLVLVLAAAAWRTTGQPRAALCGAASGVSFALTAVFMSGALAGGWSWALFGHWQTYLVAVAGITAMALLQAGMQAGNLVAVQPGVTLVDPVVAVVLGVLLFDEGVRSGGWIVVELVGAIAVGFGAVGLTRSEVADAQQDNSSGDRSGRRRGDRSGVRSGDRGAAAAAPRRASERA